MNTGGYPMLDANYSRNRELIKVGNKVVGCLQDNKFIKSVIGSRHRLRRPSAWTIDSSAFDDQIKPNAAEIVIIDKETGKKYHCSVKAFDRLKGELDRGFGRQYFLTLSHWRIENNGHKQLSLWGGNSVARY
jgi:hypothetical protein